VRPADLALGPDGTGCAAFASHQVAGAPRSSLLAAVEASVQGRIELLGVRHLDGDGRDVAVPTVTGLTLVGFRRLDA
jgi:hypothetical protein